MKKEIKKIKKFVKDFVPATKIRRTAIIYLNSDFYTKITNYIKPKHRWTRTKLTEKGIENIMSFGNTEIYAVIFALDKDAIQEIRVTGI